MNNILGGERWPPPSCPALASSFSWADTGSGPAGVQGRVGTAWVVYECLGIYSLFVYSSSLFAGAFVSRNYPESDLQDSVKLARSFFLVGPL